METLENPKTREKLKNLAKKYNLDLLILFGSRAQKTNKKYSDFDLAFYKSDISTKEEMRLFEDIINIIEFEKIDLVNISTNHNAKLRNEIFSKGQPIYQKRKGLFFELKGKAWIDYQDFRRFEPKNAQILKRSIDKMQT
jgi:uncharacterized protein